MSLRCRQSRRKYKWELWKELQNGTYITDNSYSSPNNQVDSSFIYFGKESVPVGKYRLRMLVIFEDLGQFQTDEIYLEFRLPPFMTMIVGGSVRIAYLLEDLNLTAISYDKVKRYKHVQFKYEWKCVNNLTYENVDKILGEFGTSDGSVSSSQSSSCDGSGISTFKISIPKTNLYNNTWYMFQVMASKLTNESTTGNAETHRSSTAIQAVFIEPYKTPKIQIM